MRGFAKLVAGGRAAVAAGASSSSSLLKPSQPLAVLPRAAAFARPSSSPSSSALSPARRPYASSSSSPSTSLLDDVETEVGERPQASKDVLAQDERADKAAGAPAPAAGQAAPTQETRAAVLERLAKQPFTAEMWAEGRKRAAYERRLQVHQDGAADECRWKTDPFTQSIWKLNRVARLVRRLPIDEALIQLKFNVKRSSIRLYKSLLDGKRRAIEKGLNEEKLIVHEAWTEKALTVKRRYIMGRGRTGIQLKRSSRVYFVLKEDKPFVEKIDSKHQYALQKVRNRGANAHVRINHFKVKVERASTGAWRW